MKRARKRTEVAPGQKKNPAEAGFSIVRNRCATRGSILRRLDVELVDQRRERGNFRRHGRRGRGRARRTVIVAVAPVITAVIASVAQTAVSVVIAVITAVKAAVTVLHL